MWEKREVVKEVINVAHINILKYFNSMFYSTIYV